MNAKRPDSADRTGFPAKLLRIIRPGPTIAVVACYAIAVMACLAAVFGRLLADPQEFAVGRVAARDVVAERTVSYVDEEATRLRLAAQEQLVPAVFVFSEEARVSAKAAFQRFADLSRGAFASGSSAEAFKLTIQAQYPGAFAKDTLDALHRNPGRERLLSVAAELLERLLDDGVVALPADGLDRFNPDVLEIVRDGGQTVRHERVARTAVVTLAKLDQRIASLLRSGAYPSAAQNLAPRLLAPFVLEDVFFSAESSAERLAEARASIQPVVKRIERGEPIVKKGSIISEADLARLRALDEGAVSGQAGRIVGIVLLVGLAFVLMLFLAGNRGIGRQLRPAEIYLLVALSAGYFVLAALASRLDPPTPAFPISVFLPTALATMLPAVLMGTRAAAALAVTLPLAMLAGGLFNLPAFFFALASGVAGAYAARTAERRIDLVKAGGLIALAQVAAAVGVLLLEQVAPGEYPVCLFWAAFNGLACGITALGTLPLLEQALNTATPYRLIELSDLNSPILKRLLTAAPGTYSHSVTVANLAEAACREIGADVLLARVGAYYHDIGKMDQPDYFIENQAAYNKHDELAPRLSATVIRSHVKQGVEKARRLGLPPEVVDIIAEHHGNSVISWFYNEALKREDQVNSEDFAYPGNPPRRRESAVVMLADTVEAAVRSMKKPTISRLDKFVQELIMAKFEQGQLSESELTFRDLEMIKNAFVRVLAGHYHSRIEYPKAREMTFR
jgi:putative nucleotidyltransferase with HDIG domain